MTYKSLPADVIDKRVHNLGQQLGADPRSPDFRWVSIHTRFPLSTRLKHVRHDISFTEVVFVQHRANLDLLDDVWRESQYCLRSTSDGHHTHGMLQYSLLYIPLNSEDELQQQPQEYHT